MNTSNLQNKTHPVTVGIDTSKTKLDIYIRPLDEHFIVDNNPHGVKAAIKRIKPLNPERIVIEATGRLETLFAVEADKSGLPVVIANPLQVHKFASATGQFAKSDRLDARLIAYFGEAIKPRITDIKPENILVIQDLLVRRSQLMEMSTMEKNRLSMMPRGLHKAIQRHLKFITSEIEKIETTLDKLIDNTPQWQETRDILMSVKGGGKVLTYTLPSDLPELGELNRKEIAALVGVAPMNKESGTYTGKRRIRGGRHRVRTVLFMSMLSTIQSNAKFKATYQRLLRLGKPKKVALVACMRKMLITLNTMVSNRTRRDEKLA